MKFQAPIGMKDLTKESKLYRKLEDDFFSILTQESFTEIRTPILEDKKLYSRSVGESSDIVSKEMFETLDGLVLRPENTASVMRAFVNDSELCPRLAYFAPQFRKERPQKGRLRQFYQYGFEIIGDASPQAEIDSLLIIQKLYQKWGLTNYEIQVNFLGKKIDRENYINKLRTYLESCKEKLSNLSKERLEKNILRILDSKEESDQDIIKNAPIILDSLSEESKKQWQKILDLSSLLNIKLVINPLLVRGLDYYTGMVFEVVDTSGLLGSQKALGGGGRYDGLSKELGGQDLSAFGFAGGVERLIIATNLDNDKDQMKKIGFVTTEKSILNTLFALKKQTKDIIIDINVDTTIGFKKMFKRANKNNCEKVVIIGSDELANNTFKLKNMITGEEKICNYSYKEIVIKKLMDEE